MGKAPANISLLYVTNPMCAWCYGFTPVVRRLRALWHGRIEVQVMFGDFQAHATEPMHHEQKEQVALSWHRVQERTFLPFDYRFFIQRSYVFNTEPACRAMLCVRLLRPVLTLEVLRAMHSAFFVDNQDLKDTEVLIRLVRMFGIPENLFLTLYESEEISRQLEEEFAYADGIGAATYPSMFLQTAEGIQRITAGYVDLDELEERLLQVV